MLSIVLFAGCGRNDVQVYRVAKEPAQPQNQNSAQGQLPAGMPPGHPDAGGSMPSLKYTLPDGWKEVAAGDMRAAAFHIQSKEGKQADLGIIPLPGFTGGDLESVNRWRSSVSQPPVTEADLPKLAQPIEIAGQPGQLYEQSGENPGSGEKSRILVGVLRKDGIAWFFKMNGDDDLVAQQKPTFLDFLKSVSFVSGMASAALPPSHPPVSGGPMVGAPPPPPGTADSNRPKWQVPPGWQETSGGQFLVAKFLLTGAGNTQASVNVSMALGEGGGLVANVNRWRKQIGMGDLAEAEINKLVTLLDTSAGKAMLIDMTGSAPGTGQPIRLVAALVPQAGRTWFYKLMGSEAIVSREKDAFSKFVQTAAY